LKLTTTIDDLAPAGEGVGRAGARAVFVPYTAPGDRVVAEAPAPDPSADPGAPLHAALAAVEVAGEGRVAPPCSHFGVDAPGLPPPPHPGRDRACGGCEWLHLAYPLQVERKARSVRETLRRIGKLDPGTYDERPPLGSPAPLRYRARAKFHLDRRSGRLAYFRRRSHEPVRLHECHLLEPGLDALREAVGPALVTAGLAAVEVALEWSEHAGRGSAYLRVADPGAAARRRAEALLQAVPALQGVVLGATGEGPGAPPAVVGDPVLRHLRDPRRPEAGWQRSRPDVFQQANRGANALLVEEALALLAPGPDDAVLELFCGAGNFTAPLAARARSVAAIEVAGPALDLARADLRDAGEAGGRVRFYAGDALRLGAALARERGPDAPGFRLALLDPPREGAKGVGPLLRDLAVERAVYVSCDPATFARDLRACAAAGLRVASVRALDLFPQTHHVEAVALLVRA
jgi:23S rRNA (uracil1939-C5)-methyltransferase